MVKGERIRRTVSMGVIVAAMAVGPILVFAQAGDGGPQIVFFGLLRADDTLVDPSGVDAEGRAVYDRPFGSGFSLVVEASRGPSERLLGNNTYDESGCPDLQVQVSRSLGNGSTAVCDTVPPEDGGVPALDPPRLDGAGDVCNALNDLGCRFVDGAGHPQGRQCSEACVLFPSGEFGCVSPKATTQFCGRIAKSAEFPVGDTLVTARVRNIDGVLSAPAQIIVRVATPTATATPTQTPTFTSTPTVTRRPYKDDDGCTMVRRSEDSPHWGSLIILLPLLVLGRRLRSGAGLAAHEGSGFRAPVTRAARRVKFGPCRSWKGWLCAGGQRGALWCSRGRVCPRPRVFRIFGLPEDDGSVTNRLRSPIFSLARAPGRSTGATRAKPGR